MSAASQQRAAQKANGSALHAPCLMYHHTMHASAIAPPPTQPALRSLQLLAPPLLALLASALEVQAARREEWQRQQAEQEGTELRDIGGGARGGRQLQRIALLLPGERAAEHLWQAQWRAPAAYSCLKVYLSPSGLQRCALAGTPSHPLCCLRFLAPPAAYSNAGVAVVVGLLLAALSNPVLLTMPHAGTLLAALWRWGSGQQATDARHFRRRLLHIYTGSLHGGAGCRVLAKRLSSARPLLHNASALPTFNELYSTKQLPPCICVQACCWQCSTRGRWRCTAWDGLTGQQAGWGCMSSPPSSRQPSLSQVIQIATPGRALLQTGLP